ncbi:MAG: hypothetical protein WBF81_00480 [Thermoplasmata archaeon]
MTSFHAERPRALHLDLKGRGSAELVPERALPLRVFPTSLSANALFGDLTGKQSNA